MDKRYIIASSDLAVEVTNEFDTIVYALDFNMLSFCSDCGAIVYRTDLHDNWHKKLEQVSRNANGIKT